MSTNRFSTNKLTFAYLRNARTYKITHIGLHDLVEDISTDICVHSQMTRQLNQLRTHPLGRGFKVVY